MHSAAPDEMKHIPTSRWEAWCDTFANGNRGRLIRIELDEELGGEPLVAGAKLVAIDYDPPAKVMHLPSVLVLMRPPHGIRLTTRSR